MAQILSLAISSLLFKLSMEFQMLSIILFISVSLIWFFFQIWLFLTVPYSLLTCPNFSFLKTTREKSS